MRQNTPKLSMLRENLRNCLNEFLIKKTPTSEELAEFFKRWYSTVKTQDFTCYDISRNANQSLTFYVQFNSGAEIKISASFEDDHEMAS